MHFHNIFLWHESEDIREKSFSKISVDTKLSGQGISHSRWWSRGVPIDRNSENAFPEGIF